MEVALNSVNLNGKFLLFEFIVNTLRMQIFYRNMFQCINSFGVMALCILFSRNACVRCVDETHYDLS